MSGHLGTRACQVQIPVELRKQTHEEIREEKEAKEWLAKEKKDKLAVEKVEKQKGREGALTLVAAFKDKQVLLAKTLHSLCPDLESVNLPKVPQQSSRYAADADGFKLTECLPSIGIAKTAQSQDSPQVDWDPAADTMVGLRENCDNSDSMELPPIAPPDTDSEGLMDVDDSMLHIEDGSKGIAHSQSSWWEEGTAGQRLEHGPTAWRPPVPWTLDRCGIPTDIHDRLAMSGCVTAVRIEAGLGTNRGRICPCQRVGADATLVTL
ncbi:hypothetical protein IW261DRAFT_1645497 [Armillaria novae-zelandiae]|uniref:Uncharacterized protein n=1 Tax=Armillaria novae-zelandiae TaxID=153914 RepID=A0AA39P0M4_9AGAR|nr:hypothetical protein IW261DRAFT_1645497 [Armillaria novae-zelandiae]